MCLFWWSWNDRPITALSASDCHRDTQRKVITGPGWSRCVFDTSQMAASAGNERIVNSRKLSSLMWHCFIKCAALTWQSVRTQGQSSQTTAVHSAVIKYNYYINDYTVAKQEPKKWKHFQQMNKVHFFKVYLGVWKTDQKLGFSWYNFHKNDKQMSDLICVS